MRCISRTACVQAAVIRLHLPVPLTPIGPLGINSYNLSRIAIAFIWLYHGLIPKLIFSHATELELVEKGPVIGTPEITIMIAGIAEVIVGLCVVVLWKSKWPIYLSLAGFAMLLMGAAVVSPGHAVHAFNPITLTVSAIIFCLIQLSEFRSR